MSDMFRERLIKYVLEEHRRRIRDDCVSAIIAFLFCMFLLSRGQSELTVAVGTVGVVVVCMVAFTVYFCRQKQ